MMLILVIMLIHNTATHAVINAANRIANDTNAQTTGNHAATQRADNVITDNTATSNNNNNNNTDTVRHINIYDAHNDATFQ